MPSLSLSLSLSPSPSPPPLPCCDPIFWPQLPVALRSLQEVHLGYDRGNMEAITAAAPGWPSLQGSIKGLDLKVYPGPLPAQTLTYLAQLGTGLTRLAISGAHLHNSIRGPTHLPRYDYKAGLDMHFARALGTAAVLLTIQSSSRCDSRTNPAITLQPQAGAIALTPCLLDALSMFSVAAAGSPTSS